MIFHSQFGQKIPNGSVFVSISYSGAIPDQKAVHTANGSTCRINTLLLLHPTTPAECMLILLNLTGAYILHVMKSFNQKTALRKHVQHLCFFNFEYFSCVSIY